MSHYSLWLFFSLHKELNSWRLCSCLCISSDAISPRTYPWWFLYIAQTFAAASGTIKTSSWFFLSFFFYSKNVYAASILLIEYTKAESVKILLDFHLCWWKSKDHFFPLFVVHRNKFGLGEKGWCNMMERDYRSQIGKEILVTMIIYFALFLTFLFIFIHQEVIWFIFKRKFSHSGKSFSSFAGIAGNFY